MDLLTQTFAPPVQFKVFQNTWAASLTFLFVVLTTASLDVFFSEVLGHRITSLKPVLTTSLPVGLQIRFANALVDFLFAVTEFGFLQLGRLGCAHGGQLCSLEAAAAAASF